MSTGFSKSSEDADKGPIWREGGSRTKEATGVQSKEKERKDLIVNFIVVVFEESYYYLEARISIIVISAINTGIR
jgi:hypothetical protein